MRLPCAPIYHDYPRDMCGNPTDARCIYCGEHTRTTTRKARWRHIRRLLTGDRL